MKMWNELSELIATIRRFHDPGTSLCGLGSLDVIDPVKETNFILNTTVSPQIVADEHTGWIHNTTNEDVGYICEQEGMIENDII